MAVKFADWLTRGFSEMDWLQLGNECKAFTDSEVAYQKKLDQLKANGNFRLASSSKVTGNSASIMAIDDPHGVD